MNILTDLLPNWISILFITTIPLQILIISQALKEAGISSGFDMKKASYFQRVAIVFLSLFIIYVSILSVAGIFLEVTFPPKILVYATFPLIAILFGVIDNLSVFKTLMKNAKLDSLVKLHLFRLGGLFIIIPVFYDAIPPLFAYLAGIGDVLTALFSIYVVNIIQQKKPYAKKVTLLWNIFGMADSVVASILALVITYNQVEHGTQGLDILASLPLSIIPAYAPGIILLTHVIIFKKLKSDN